MSKQKIYIAPKSTHESWRITAPQPVRGPQYPTVLFQNSRMRNENSAWKQPLYGSNSSNQIHNSTPTPKVKTVHTINKHTTTVEY